MHIIHRVHELNFGVVCMYTMILIPEVSVFRMCTPMHDHKYRDLKIVVYINYGNLAIYIITKITKLSTSPTGTANAARRLIDILVT